MTRSLPVVGATLLLVGAGCALGLWTDRWGLSADLEQAPGKLARLPRAVGPWHGTDEVLDQRQARAAEARGYLLRRYAHADSGATLSVLVVCGRPGPVAVHSPEVCYGGSGFTPDGPRQRRQVAVEGASAPAELWVERYRKSEAALPEHVQIYYAWNAWGAWTAADNPRLKFASARALYKLYVVRRLPRDAEASAADPIPGFLRLFLAQLDRCLFSSVVSNP